jgi:hypothetical protein
MIGNFNAIFSDMESAEGIISVMKQAGLEPNDDTYVTLMCGYARKGDIENIKRIVQVRVIICALIVFFICKSGMNVF